jgi:monoamine oxidase
MNRFQLTLATRSILFAMMLVFAGAVSSVCAQGSPPVRGQQDLGMREHQMSSLERGTVKKREAKDVMAEVNEDLTRLAALNEGITTALAANAQPLDHKSFVDRAIEVKTRSTRLKTDLALPLDEKAQKRDVLKGIDITALQPVLSVLNKLLDSFLHNPVFTDTGAVDMQLATRARQDLEDIIVVSEKVKKTAEKLSKSKNP